MDDLADAAIFLLKNYDGEEIVNIGGGTDIAIKDLAAIAQKVVGYTGEVIWDTSKPDGTPRKLMDVSKLTGQGWQAGIDIRLGIRSVYAEYAGSNID